MNLKTISIVALGASILIGCGTDDVSDEVRSEIKSELIDEATAEVETRIAERRDALLADEARYDERLAELNAREAELERRENERIGELEDELTRVVRYLLLEANAEASLSESLDFYAGRLEAAVKSPYADVVGAIVGSTAEFLRDHAEVRDEHYEIVERYAFNLLRTLPDGKRAEAEQALCDDDPSPCSMIRMMIRALADKVRANG